MAFNLGVAFANLASIPGQAVRGVGRAVFGPGHQPLRELGAGMRRAFAAAPGLSEDRTRMRRPTPQEEAGIIQRRQAEVRSAPEPAFTRRAPSAPSAPKAPAAATAPAVVPEISAVGAGGWNVSSKTRDQLGASKQGARHVSLDFNDSEGNPRGVEIVIPQDATPEERRAAQEYVDRTVKWYADHGVKVPNRGVKVQGVDGQRGTTGRFHTEPFFVSDQEALSVMQKDPGGYAKILTETLGTIPGVTFHAPHKVNDPGATRGDLNERDFARSTIIPQLERLAKPQKSTPIPGGGGGNAAANPFLINPIL